ncbi:response regulator transcription factor [Terasakiella sp. SH-1]|uniref:response regulator transcription factor n=1 Tax=Terasakiella sp. SH-1 TaxID=2560057 RepID=UPI001073AEF7|nr:response regulator transcription factor [Terasakiella sp. SH-1]
MAIVLIEDHENLRNALSGILESEGFQVIALECAEDIDDTPGTHTAEAYIIDLNLPGEDGISLVKRLRRAEPNANIIVTTARSELNQRVIGYEAGADVYLSKPVDPAELIAVLCSRLGRRHSDQQVLNLNARTQEIATPSGVIPLTLAEVRVLSALTLAENHLLEQWQIMEQFGQESEGMTLSSLQMRLTRLRKKFHNVGISSDVIKAERGVGYRLCMDIQII